MAATVIVELTGDERRVLESYRKTEEADRKLREATAKTGDAAQAAGREFADAWVKAGSGATAGMEKLLNQLKRTGSEGQAAAAAIDEHFRETGKAGRRSMESIIESIAGLDGEAGRIAAAAAEAIKSELAEADNQTAFNKTLSELRMIAPEAAKAAQAVRAGMSEADALTRFDNTIAALRAIDPVAADEAAKVRASLEQAAKDADFRETLEALRALGPIGQATAAAIQQDMNAAAAATQASFDDVISKVGRIAPQAAETAERVQREFAEAARQSDFRQTIESLRKLGPEGEKLSRALQQNLEQAAAQSVGSIDGIIEKIKDIDPAAAKVAERLRLDLAAADAKTNFDRSLAELRKINPEAANAAEGVLAKMNAADDQVKFDNILEELRKVDPVAAAEAAKLRGHMVSAPKEAESAFTKFGTSAVGQITGIAGAYVGIQQAIQTVINLNRKVIETNKEVFEGLKKTESGDKRLLQVAESQEDFQALRGKADALAKDYGIGREEARGLMFSARSERFEDTVDFIAANRQVIDVQAQAAVAGQVPALFKSEGVSGEQVINATLAGAQASRLSFEEIGRALPGASEGAVLQGARSDETIGALSVLASEFKSGDTAADRIKALATAMSLDQGDDKTGRESLAGVGLIEGVDRLMKMTEEQRRDFLGNSAEVNVAYSKFAANIDEIKARQEMVAGAIKATGTKESPVNRAREIAEYDPMLASLRRVAISENRLEIEKEQQRAEDVANQQSTRNNALTEAEASGASPLAIAAAEQAGETLEGFGLGGVVPQAISRITGSKFQSLERDLTLAAESGDKAAGPALLAARKLREARLRDTTALIPLDAALELVRATDNPEAMPSDITDEMRGRITSAIIESAEDTRGAAALTPNRLFGPLATIAGASTEFSLAREGAGFAENIAGAAALQKLDEIKGAMERQAAALEQQNALVAQQNGLLAETASNTRPEGPQPPNFDAAYQASLQEQDDR